MAADYDVLVIGGGINGLGIARDAAGRGLSVLLCEADDLAAHTSSASSKLIHGGLRYLEFGEFMLVRKALRERARLMRSAPHLIWPRRFVVPCGAASRPAWMLRAGLFLYDHLASRAGLPASRLIDLNEDAEGGVLRTGCTVAFGYYDAATDDARLALTVAIDARDRGAIICPRTRCVSARREGGLWIVRTESAGMNRIELRARALVNAAGPWVDAVAALLRLPERGALRLVKGSHVVVPRLVADDTAYLLQSLDGRVVFVLPFAGGYSLIGTTEVDFAGDPAQAAISPEETAYLLGIVNRYFRHPVQGQDILWSFSGVRPLFDSAKRSATAASRDYAFHLDTAGPPLLTVLGGKLTTFRRLAEEAVTKLLPAVGRAAPPWTAEATLPGGDLPIGGLPALAAELTAQVAGLPLPLAQRWASAYGTRARLLCRDAREVADLGDEVLPGLFAKEIEYLVDQEWARTAADILWRRSKLGLDFPATAALQLDAWIGKHVRKADHKAEVSA